MKRFFYLAALILISACSPAPTDGPAPVVWDRDACERCRMVLSDRHYAAQIRLGAQQVHKFDDLGCAVLWLEQQPDKNNPDTQIWVNDHQSGEWLNARTAFYVLGKTTPMDYGLGASAQTRPDSLNFDQARAHILAKEANNQHKHLH